MQKQKSHNLPKFIMIMTIILLVGTLFGVVGYYLIKDNKTEIQQVDKEKLSDNKISKNSEDNNGRKEMIKISGNEHVGYVYLKDNVIYHGDEIRGFLADDKINIYLGDEILTFEGDLKKLSFGIVEGMNWNFYYDTLEISNTFQGPYAIYEKTNMDKISYKCDGSLLVTSKGEQFPNYYCETNSKDFLSQYEFSAANGNGFATGGGYSEFWYKLYIKKINGINYTFSSRLIGDTTDSDDKHSNIKKYNEDYQRLSNKKYLDEILTDEENKKKIEEWDEFIENVKFIEKDKPNSCSKEGNLSVLARSAYPYNKARITSTKGNRGGSVNFPHRTFLITDPNFILEGVNVPEVNRITVEWDGDKEIKQIQNFTRGNTHWCFDINEKIGNITPGVNIYTVKLFLDKDEIIEYGVQIIYDTYPSVILDDITINIDWFSEIKKEPVENFFSQDVLDNFYTDCNYDLPCYNLFSFYKAGSVRSGKYKNYNYYLVSRTFMGHGSSDDYYRAIFNSSEKEIILLKKYSNEPYGKDKPFFTVAENITVENLLPKKEILIPNSSYYLEAHDESPNILFSKMISIEYYKSKKIFTDPEVGDVYMEDKTKTFFVKVPDGSLKIYRIKLPFVSSREKSEDWNYDDLLLDITFTDGKVNTENYFHGSRYQFVCAGGDMYDIVPEKDLSPEKNLRLLGTSPNGEKFYEFKSNKLKEYYENTNSLSGIRYHINDNISFEQFESFHPLIFWKDPFDRWVQFTNNRLSSMAECGGGLSNSAI